MVRPAAGAGFDLSPNKAGAGNYTEPSLVKKAEAFYAAKGFTPDLGDFIFPGGFGSAEFTAIVDYVNGGNLDLILTTVAGSVKGLRNRSLI